MEAIVLQEPTKAVGQQTCTSWKAAEEAVLDDEEEVAIPKICDHFNQDLTPDYDGIPDLVEYSDDEEDNFIPLQTKQDDEIVAAIIESYSPHQFEKAKTVVHSNEQDIHSKFSSYVLTCSISIYMCNFSVSTNEYMLQGSDTKALRNTTEHNDYNASNKITRVKLGGVHDLT